MADESESTFQEGTAFFDLAWEVEAACEALTAAELPGMGPLRRRGRL
jgi:hypothetical protein